MDHVGEFVRDLPVELHVPCRSSVDHLMSQCNYKKIIFDCQAQDITQQIKGCMLPMTRYNKRLEQRIPNFLVKCFDSGQVDKHID